MPLPTLPQLRVSVLLLVTPTLRLLTPPLLPRIQLDIGQVQAALPIFLLRLLQDINLILLQAQETSQ